MLWVLLSLTLTSPLPAADLTPTVVWYRASSECPSGPEFLTKLGERAELARLAQAGDHIDFVVTLLDAGQETIGRLERQTDTGTVAIRELRDASCARVAEALALSLALSLQPNTRAAAPTDGGPPSEPELTPTAPEPTSAANETAPTGPVEGAALPKAAETRTAPPSARSERAQSHPETAWLGLQAGALFGAAPRALFRASASLTFEDPVPELLTQAALRLGAIFAFGSAPSEAGNVERSIFAGRLEGCPLRWGGEQAGLAPCLGLELGVTNARAEPRESSALALWLQVGAGLRGSLRLAPWLALELQAEGVAPLYRNEVYAGAEAIYRPKIIGFQGNIGVSSPIW